MVSCWIKNTHKYSLYSISQYGYLSRLVWSIERCMKYKNTFYTQTGWEIITLALLPVAIFYRFHSFIMLIKIVTQKYKIEHEH